MRVVNLSSRPFVNERPVVRLSVVLWALGGLLLAFNIYSYSNYWSDSKEIRGKVADLREAIDREEKDLSELTRKASAIDVLSLNDHAVFLNHLIQYRTFPWGRLFDDLEEVLPKELRLTSVQPEVERQADVERTRRRPPRRSRASSRSTSRDEPPPVVVPVPEPESVQEIPMNLKGFAKSDEVILGFVDLLFEHPRFRDPDFQRESLREDNGQIEFDISVIYLLELAEESAPEKVAETGETSSVAVAETEEVAREDGPAGSGERAVITRTTFSGEDSQGAPQSATPQDPSRARPELSAGAPAVSAQADREGSPGRPAETGAPPGGQDLAGVRIGGLQTAPPGGVHPAPSSGQPAPRTPDPPGRQRITPPRPIPPPPASGPREQSTNEERDPRLPRFVEPDASGTTPILLDDDEEIDL